MSFANKIEQQEKEAQEAGHASKGGNDWFKFEEGDNVFRVLEEPELIFEKFKVGICYTDCGYEGSPKFITYLLNRKTGKIQIAKLPYKIGTTIASYENDEDYSFTGFPMDYDIKVHAKNAGTTEVVYTITPRAKRDSIDADTAAELLKMKRIPELVAKMKENKKNEHIADGSFQREQERKEKLRSELEEKKASAGSKAKMDYPDGINPEDIPF